MGEDGILKFNDVAVGNTFTTVCLLSEASVQTAKNGSLFLKMMLNDGETSLRGIMFDANESILEGVELHKSVNIKATLEVFQQQQQLKVINIAPALDVAPERFLKTTEVPPDELVNSVLAYVATIEHAKLREVVERVLTGNDRRTLFTTAPAARKHHHACVGGLALHTLGVVSIVYNMIKTYEYLGLHKDLMLAGALVHDVGKMFDVTDVISNEYCLDGGLRGHVILGYDLVKQVGQEVALSDKTLSHLLHIVLSHHGKREWGAPVVPMTPEALFVHQADMLDSRVVGITTWLKNNKREGSLWSTWNNMVGGYLYVGSTADDVG